MWLDEIVYTASVVSSQVLHMGSRDITCSAPAIKPSYQSQFGIDDDFALTPSCQPSGIGGVSGTISGALSGAISGVSGADQSYYAPYGHTTPDFTQRTMADHPLDSLSMLHMDHHHPRGDPRNDQRGDHVSSVWSPTTPNMSAQYGQGPQGSAPGPGQYTTMLMGPSPPAAQPTVTPYALGQVPTSSGGAHHTAAHPAGPVGHPPGPYHHQHHPHPHLTPYQAVNTTCSPLTSDVTHRPVPSPDDDKTGVTLWTRTFRAVRQSWQSAWST